MNGMSLGPPICVMKRAIVLDLDETLVHTFTEVDPGEIRNISLVGSHPIWTGRDDPDIYRLALTSGVLWGRIRPFAREFLRFCFSYFTHVIVWSAGQTEYVHTAVTMLFAGLPAPYLVYTYPQCVPDEMGLLTKPLIHLILRHHLEGINLTNMVIVDDRITTYQSCNPHNGVNIPAYHPPSLTTPIRDIALCQLMRWFLQDEIRSALDLRYSDKTHIFDRSCVLPVIDRPLYYNGRGWLPTRQRVTTIRTLFAT